MLVPGHNDLSLDDLVDKLKCTPIYSSSPSSPSSLIVVAVVMVMLFVVCCCSLLLLLFVVVAVAVPAVVAVGGKKIPHSIYNNSRSTASAAVMLSCAGAYLGDSEVWA